VLRQRSSACFRLLQLGAILLLVSCGLEDGALVECRCTEDTDLEAFPHCIGAELTEGRPDAANPLSTRIPDCPSGRRLFLREPTAPKAVLFNVRDTFEGLSPDQYMDQLTEDFLFVPDVDGLQLHLQVYQPPEGYNPESDRDTLWSREDERRFAGNLLDRSRFQRVEFTRWYDASRDQTVLYDDPLVETYVIPYVLKLVESASAEGTSLTLEVRGRAEIDLVTPSSDNPVWLVRKWRDFRDAASAKRSFTELRGEYSQ